MGSAFHRLLQMPIFRDGLMDYSLGNSAQQKALRLKVKPKWKLKNRAVPSRKSGPYTFFGRGRSGIPCSFPSARRMSPATASGAWLPSINRDAAS